LVQALAVNPPISDMSTHVPAPEHVRLDSLRSFHARLVQALDAQSPPVGPAAEIIVASLSLQCEQCAIQISGAEWMATLSAENRDVLDDPRLVRLHQGYCPRKDCQSYYGRVRFKPVPGVDWTNVLKQFQTMPSEPEQHAAAAAVTARSNMGRRQMGLRLVLGGIAILVLLVLRRLYTGGSIPLLRPAHKFEIDPASTPTLPASK